MGLLKKAKSFVKKAVRKVVPKEVAGIMQIAAPFTGPAAPFVYSAGALRQRGTLGPRDLFAAATLGLPYAARVGQGQGILGSRFAYSGNLGQFGTLGKDVFTARDLLGLRDATGIRGQAERFLFGRPGVEGGSVFDTEGRFEGTFEGVKPTQGILGAGGDFKLTEGKLLSKMDAEGNIALSKAKVGAAVAAGLSLTQTQEQIEEEGEDAGLSSSEIARLQAEAAEAWKDFDTTAFRPKVAQGGLMRTNYALGSRPTEQESGLGGLPIEADMRYSGGFMPYGAKEKADDVPARLSKNEFVFTADAVRGAGGGDINTGAKRMYQSMKQLEQMGKRA
jgi:hypothetical protein